jgi:hypothetical protein
MTDDALHPKGRHVSSWPLECLHLNGRHVTENTSKRYERERVV